MSTLNALNTIRERTFGVAVEKIKKHQIRYTKNYNRRHRVWRTTPFCEGDQVQYKNSAKTGRLGGKFEPNFYPAKDFLLIASIDEKTNTCRLKQKNGKLIRHRAGKKARSWHFDFIREFKKSAYGEETVTEELPEVEAETLPKSPKPIRSRVRRKKRKRQASSDAESESEEEPRKLTYTTRSGRTASVWNSKINKGS